MDQKKKLELLKSVFKKKIEELEGEWKKYFTNLASLDYSLDLSQLNAIGEVSKSIRDLQRTLELSFVQRRNVRNRAYVQFRRERPDEAKALGILEGREKNALLCDKLEQIEGTKRKHKKPKRVQLI